MLSEFRKKKMTRVFEMLDLNKNGFLEQSDYERLADNLSASRGIDPASAEGSKIKTKYLAAWATQAGSNDPKTHRVDLAGWLASRETLLADPKNYAVLVQSLVDQLVEQVDTDRDGKLSFEEYALLFRVYGMDGSRAKTAFTKLDADADGYLSQQELQAAFKDFYYSDDPAATGNWLIGEP